MSIQASTSTATTPNNGLILSSLTNQDANANTSTSTTNINSPIHNNITPNNNNHENSREVYKAGWLRYVPFAERPSSGAAAADGEHRFWVVFAVRNESNPYLEFYQKRQPAITPDQTSRTPPVSRHSLRRCQHVAPSICLSADQPFVNEFAVTLDIHNIRLVADSQQAMCDWIDTLRSRLRAMGVLPSGDNLYMREPQPLPRQRSLCGNQFRPLPPLPVIQSGPTTSNSFVTTSVTTPVSDSTIIDTGSARSGSPTEIYEAIFDNNRQPLPQPLPPPLPPQPSSAPVAQPPLPIRTYHTRSVSLPVTAGSSSSPQSPLAALEPLNSHLPTEEGPPPYESIVGASAAPVSLRESQVLRLRKEIAHPSGVRLTVRKKDCHHSIALIDLSDGVWIAGWRQKEYPVLHNTFHIGDRLLSINGDPVSATSQAYKLIKQHHTAQLEIIVRRVPYGRVYCIRRRHEGQELGIVRDGGQAEIVAVVRGGLADKAGLNQRAIYGDQQTECNWSLTEVNNRPLNMFYKDRQIEDRLQAVGKEISILVQPTLFVKHLKKQLKQLRNYKEYIVQ